MSEDEIAYLLGELAAMPARLEQALKGLDEAALSTPPAPGTWSPLEVLVHLRASDDILSPRLYQILVRDAPPLAAFDERRWADVVGYAALPLRLLLTSYATRRAELVPMLRGLPATAWERAGEHEAHGRVTLRQIVRHLVTHEAEHYTQIEATLRDR